MITKDTLHADGGRRFVLHVEGQGTSLYPTLDQSRASRLQLLRITAVEPYLCAGLGQPLRHLEAQPPPGPGDKGHLAGQGQAGESTLHLFAAHPPRSLRLSLHR
ncbi:hypothetical protein D9M68_565020 [compost metagenome]